MEDSDFNKFYEAGLTSSIVLEIDKVKEEYFRYSINEQDMANSLEKIIKYEEHKNDIILDRLFEFLVTIAQGGPRNWETSNISNTLEGIVINYFVFGYYKSKQKSQSFFNHGKECVNVGAFLVYDPFIHSKNYPISENGFSILKYVYHEGIKYKDETGENLKREVLQAFDWLNDALDRPERDDLEDAKEFLRIYREDLEEPGLMTPQSMPQRLLNLLR